MKAVVFSTRFVLLLVALLPTRLRAAPLHHSLGYIIHMSDGSIEDLPIVYGRNVRSERGDYRKVPEAEVAWDGEGIRTGAGRRVRMLKVTWENPTPTMEVSRIDFISAVSRSAPHLLAVTVDP
jgi:hypothetical protein